MPERAEQQPRGPAAEARYSRYIGLILAGLIAFILFVIIAGEWLGLFDLANARVPLPLGIALVLVAGFPVFRNVIRATLRGQIIAALTLIIRRDPLAAAAVLVVACSCSIALATPIAMLASIGAAARRGLLIKGGRDIETLARVDVLLIDKTGTLTLGRPHVTEVMTIGSNDGRDALLRQAGSAERYSEHPLAQAVRDAAYRHGVTLAEPAAFESLPGQGVRATIDDRHVTVGNRAFVTQAAPGAWPDLGILGNSARLLKHKPPDSQFLPHP